MPIPKYRSRDNTPRSPQSKAFRNCQRCGLSNSIRRPNCSGCGVLLKKVARRKKEKLFVKRSSYTAMSTTEDQPTDTLVDPQEVATTAEEGSPRSHDPHPSHQSPPPDTPSTLSEERSTGTLPFEVDAGSRSAPSSHSSTESQQNSPSHTNGITPSQQSQPTPPHVSQESQHTPPPPPDFFTALGMKPSTSQHHASSPTRTSSASDGEGEGGGADEEMDADNSESSLRERFNKDPSEVLDLLKSTLSLEKLSQLLGSEQSTSTEQLELLQGKLNSAYQTLKHCAEHKAALTQNIEETSEKIKGKRRHLESLREDLRALGEEEMALKKRRDSAHSQCAQLKRKLKASREALQQISALEKNDSILTKDAS